MSVLDESIRQILSVEGTRAAAVIDAGTGMIVCSAGELDPGIPDAAAAMAQEARAANSDGASGVLEGIATMSDRWCHLLEVLELRRGEGLLLFVDVDRSMTNVALASLQVRKLIPGLLA
ncbi:MAG TPA: hypothetical protein VFI65_33420 [Streptosporangiaceae bacterium]|nr:hypothetical protein [Streptosporangiaceae bacterium]